MAEPPWIAIETLLPTAGDTVSVLYDDNGTEHEISGFYAPSHTIRAGASSFGVQYFNDGTFYTEGWYTSDPRHILISNVIAWKALI